MAGTQRRGVKERWCRLLQQGKGRRGSLHTSGQRPVREAWGLERVAASCRSGNNLPQHGTCQHISLRDWAWAGQNNQRCETLLEELCQAHTASA